RLGRSLDRAPQILQGLLRKISRRLSLTLNHHPSSWIPPAASPTFDCTWLVPAPALKLSTSRLSSARRRLRDTDNRPAETSRCSPLQCCSLRARRNKTSRSADRKSVTSSWWLRSRT